ncbi:MAG: radical SAM protein [Candidatus Omnitrophica bacterium]|nr:radical SAM protein [Candidatus Omnitrophota bacterium]
MKVDRLKSVAKDVYKLLESCEICPRRCKVNRLKGERGFCKGGLRPTVVSAQPHFGEEPPLSGVHGSGTIFFTYCNMRCVYCQNYTFSQLGEGNDIEVEELVSMMLSLQRIRCHNINLVTPTHFLPQIVHALSIAVKDGLSIPIVYNTSGYELAEVLRLLDGIVDIYMPDMRYADEDEARLYSNAPDYPRLNREAVCEMQRQVGVLDLEDDGIAKRGLIIRHLVLPNGISGTSGILKFIKDEISPDTYISLMDQYHPSFKAMDYPLISRRLKDKEYEEACNIMFEMGLKNGWMQGDITEMDRERFLGDRMIHK